MKFISYFWIFVLGWMILFFMYFVSGTYFNNWSFTETGLVEKFQVDLKSKIDMDSSSIFFSVKTTPAYYKNRLDVLKTTWFQVVPKDKLSIVSDYLNDSHHDEKRFEGELIKENFKLVLARCIIRHGSRALCCKSGTEYKQFYDYLKSHLHGQNLVKWFCHFDDDVYVNVKELSKLLSQYNSSEPYYIGRNARGPYGVKVDQYRLNSLKRNYHVNKTNYVYASGAAYCNSLALMKELYKYFSHGLVFKRGVLEKSIVQLQCMVVTGFCDPNRFGYTCGRTKTTDDLTIGAIIHMVLNHKLTNVKSMTAQGMSLKHISMVNLTKMITLSFRTDRKDRQKIFPNIDPKPRIFSTSQDPTRFLTFHCLLYNETSWCQANNQIPSKLMSNHTNVSTSGIKTLSPTPNTILLQASNQELLQASNAAEQSDLQSKKPINETKEANIQNGLQKSNHSDTYQSAANTRAATDNQTDVNKTFQTHSYSLNASNDEASLPKINHVDSLTPNQTHTQQSHATKIADSQTVFINSPSRSQAYQEQINDRDSKEPHNT